jgi:hypothetical protein
MREAARRHTQACTRHPASPQHPPQKTLKTPSKTPPQDTFILRHVHIIKHQNTQRYELQSSQSQIQARNLAHETNSGPDSAHRLVKPLPPQSALPPSTRLQATKKQINEPGRLPFTLETHAKRVTGMIGDDFEVRCGRKWCEISVIRRGHRATIVAEREVLEPARKLAPANMSRKRGGGGGGGGGWGKKG